MASTNQQKFENPNAVQQGLIGKFQITFIAELKKLNPTSILEVGCGEGFLLSRIHRELPTVKVLGLDYSQPALDEGHRLFPDLDLQFGDIYKLQQPDRSWDVVIASEVLEHLDHPEQGLAELKRVAQRYLLLSVPNEPWFRLGNFARGRHFRRLGNHPEHVNLWSQHGFGRFVGTQATVERLTGSFPWTIARAKV